MALMMRLDVETRRKRRVFRRRKGLNELRDWEVVSRYRMDRPTIERLIHSLSNDLQSSTCRSQAIDTEIQVLVGLRCLAKASFFSEVGDLHGISKTSVSCIFDKFINAVNKHVNNISFQDTNKSKLEFYRKCEIPNVIGAIDGSLIPIKAPKHDEAAYVCRKGFHAINIQATVDYDMRITDIVAKWPGSQHDAFIFENSGLKARLEESNFGILLGDSGYPLKKYLMTPLLNPTNDAENTYNKNHMKGRSVVEHTFGVLKSRFRCLHKSGGNMLFTPEKACRVVLACAKLHNLCLDMNSPLPDIVNDNSNETVEICRQPVLNNARHVQREIIRQFINN